MPSLLIFEGTYYAQLDEAAFFKWLEAIAGVTKVVRTPSGLLVTLRSSKLSEASLRDLLALHWRYSLPMKDLARFLNDGNDHWFNNKAAYWYEAVFGVRAVSADITTRVKELYAVGKSKRTAANVLCREYPIHKNEASRRILISGLWQSALVHSKVQHVKGTT